MKQAFGLTNQNNVCSNNDSLAETPIDRFEIFAGFRQGGPDSPLIYNLFIT